MKEGTTGLPCQSGASETNPSLPHGMRAFYQCTSSSHSTGYSIFEIYASSNVLTRKGSQLNKTLQLFVPFMKRFATHVHKSFYRATWPSITAFLNLNFQLQLITSLRLILISAYWLPAQCSHIFLSIYFLVYFLSLKYAPTAQPGSLPVCFLLVRILL